MRRSYIIVNTQSFGDCLLGTHAARLLKQKDPESLVIFAIRQDMLLTTQEHKQTEALADMLKIFSWQEGVDYVGLYTPEGVKVLNYTPTESLNNTFIWQSEWWSDLGIMKSQLVEVYKQFPADIWNTETKFNVNSQKQLPKHLRVATAGPLDWSKKLFTQRFLRYLTNETELEVIPMGADVKIQPYSDALKELNNCHAYIGPAGSLAHAAAGLGLDTITISDIFPNAATDPASYHSGYHKTISAPPEKHCKTYPCITTKNYDPTIQGNWGNPPTEFGFWPKNCHYMPDGYSCISNIALYQLKEEVAKWEYFKNSQNG